MRRAFTLFGRALRRRCPRCGARGVFAGWFRLRPYCASCGMAFERDEGYWTGAVALNLIVTEAVFGAVALGVALATWPDVPWTPLTVAGVTLSAAVPLAFYPLSKTLWIALDLLIHPLEPLEEMDADLRL